MSFNIWNRRYTGSKFKLVDWIVDLIQENCTGESFCDIFGGTGVVAAKILPHMKVLYINDLLYANELSYKAFFGKEKVNYDIIEKFSKKYSDLKVEKIKENYISKNYGGKFFSNNDAKLIGYIREDIEKAEIINQQERNILLTSLIYSADKSANTVGHYDAYIKGKEFRDKFKFDLINPVNSKNKDIVITREDANVLAENLVCDIVYIDPPYNSRQYSRFYHVLENIVTWKKPELEGIALKPPMENMSEYCRSNAKFAFEDLIMKLNCQYIVISYNNTYLSKSKSSRNKIEFEDMVNILNKKGTVLKFERKHQFFNAGKTKFNDHKEYVYIVKVGIKHDSEK